ncbi:MAG: class I adenylate-forming enzyme family protein [Actinomycetota bacterium]
MKNLAQLLADRRERGPERRIGLIDHHEPFAELYDRAAGTATVLPEAGLSVGSRVAVIGTNSRDYLQAWMALQLAGVEAALLNPTYPPRLLGEMLDDLEPDAVLWVGPEPQPDVRPQVRHLDLRGVTDGVLQIDGARSEISPSGPGAGVLPRLDRAPGDVAGYMHTSGTTGTPKFCRQTHEYFLRLGRFIADSMLLSPADTVFAPLPLFHINPLGYGVIGGLVAGADVLSAARFSASRFWPDVREAGATALILHAPPVEILKRATTPADAAGHQVRVVFFADREFLEDFDIPAGVSAYGSTEAGGLCHTWIWRRGDVADLPEGMSRYGGKSRHEVEWRVTEDGEIEVRATRPNVLFDGYWKRGELRKPFDEEGWFATGDLGRVDEDGNLVFIERRAESIRVKGEFVPIGFVEDHFSKVRGVGDVAVWRQANEMVDDDVALFVTGEDLDLAEIRAAREALPAFMRPAVLVRVPTIPRDDGVGKIRRRQLGDVPALERVGLA